MLATKLLVAGLVAYVTATPVASAPQAETTDWTPYKIPHDSIDWDGIDMDSVNNSSNWRDASYTKDLIRGMSRNPGSLSTLNGPCDQGDCPDWDAAFDLVHTFTAVPLPGNANYPGCPPLTLWSSDSDIRVNECGQCFRHGVGSSAVDIMYGGCFDFQGCGRDQTICVDQGKGSAHRVWKDSGFKTCYRMDTSVLGSCDFVKSRIVIHPSGVSPCDW